MNDSTTPLWLQVPEPSDLVKAFRRGSERELDEWLSRREKTPQLRFN